MFSHAPVVDTQPENLLKDKILWLQVLLASQFFITSGIWMSVVPRQIKFNLGYSESVVGLTALIFSVFAIASRPFINKYGPRVNRHTLIFIGVALVMTAGFLAVLSDALIMVFITRILIAIGDGVVYIGISTLILANAKETQHATALSLYTISAYLGVTIGPVIGERLYAANASEVWMYAGAVTVLSGIVMIVLLRKLPSRHIADTERTKKHAAFCKPALLPGILFLFGISAWVGLAQFAPIFADTIGVHDVSLLFAIIGIGVIIIRLTCGPFIDRTPTKYLMMLSLGSGVIAALVFSQANSYVALYVGAIFIAVSNGFFYPSFAIVALRRGHEYDKGTVIGTLSMFFDLAFGILPPVLGVIASRHGYTWMFRFVVALVILAYVISLFMKVPPPAPLTASERDALVEPDPLG